MNHNARLAKLERQVNKPDGQDLESWASFADESALQTALAGGRRIAKTYIGVSPDDWDANMLATPEEAI